MAKIARFNGNVQAFASNQQSGERRIFGATDPAEESDLLSDQLTPEFLRGWATVGPSEFPPIEWFNAVGFTVTQFIAYLHQVGVPEWNSLQEYHANSITNYNGSIYVSEVDNNIGNNPLSSSEWYNPETRAQEELTNGKIFPKSGVLQNGDTVPPRTPPITHLRALVDGKSKIVAMSPIASGVVTSLTDDGAIIGGVSVSFSGMSIKPFSSVAEMLGAETSIGGTYTTGSANWKRTSGDGSDIADFEQLSPAAVSDFEIVGSKTSCVTIENLLSQGVEFVTPEILHTLDYAFSQWKAGNKFPIAFFGDSTTDGAGSTTNGVDEATVFNFNFLVSDMVPDGFNHDHDETEVPNAYPSILQRMIRAYTGNNTMRLYNAGYRGQRLCDGWAQRNIHNAVYANTSYSDCKMIGVNFGLNDSDLPGDTLVSQTILRTESIILDAYNRGVQPFLMTCSMSGRAGDAKYNTADIDLTIDNAKRQLAAKYGIPCIEVADFFTRYISENNDFVSYQDLTFDDLHYSDLGYLKQSEFMFKHFAGDVAVQDVSDAIGIDYTSPCMRLKGIPFNNISSGTTVSRGVSQRLRNIVCGNSELDAIKGTSFVDAWVWNENPDRFVIYSNYTDQASDGSVLSSLNDAVSISASSREHLVGTGSNDFSMPDPDAYGADFATTYRIEAPVKMRRLEYGLNYIRISVPSSLDVNYLNSTNFFGPFYFYDISENTPIVSYDTFIGGAVNFIESDCFIDSVPSRELPALSLNQRYFEPNNGLNFGGVPNVGDVFEVMVEAEVPSDSGVIIGYNLYDVLSISGLDKNKYVVGGDTWFVSNSTNLKIAMRGPTGATLLDLDMGFTYPTEPYVIKVERELSTSIKFSVISLDGTELGSQSTSDPRTLKSWSGLVVGGAIGLGATDSVKINSIKVR